MKYKIRLLYFFFFTLFTIGCVTKKNQISSIEITGTITDCENEKLKYAIIGFEQDKKNHQTFSDSDGFYKIIVPDTNAVINYIYPGLQSQSIRISNQQIINVTLKKDTTRIKKAPTYKANSIDDLQRGEIAGKPVIYLYPQSETEVFVQVDFTGNFLFTYPQYNQGWNVIASPDGILKNKTDNKEYSYLFWDGEFRYEEKDRNYKTGFIVHRDSTVSFLQEMLPKLGLQPHEYNEFIVFWMPYLKKNEWNFVHFRIGEDYNVISKNIVNPAPDSEIRVFMDYKKVKKPFEINPQEFTSPSRNGFTLVEWGGTELQQEIKVKTKEGKYLNL